MLFCGSVAISVSAPEFRTLFELISAAINARTYDANSTINSQRKAEAISRLRSVAICEIKFRAASGNAGPIYMMDAFKGVVNGITTQAAYSAGDFTATPGGAVQVVAGADWDLDTSYSGTSQRIFYAAASSTLYVEINEP